MGSAITKAANGIGGVLGNAFLSPFKSIFGGSCEDVCSGPWDVMCFIEHLCVSNLVKLLMILGLCYIIMMFCYLLFKVGICQCVCRSLCKMCWAACETYWYALEDMTCFLWHKLKNTKRVNRRRHRRRRQRFRDIEASYISSSDSNSDFLDNYHHYRHRHNYLNETKKRNRERRTDQSPSSVYSSSQYSVSSCRRRHHQVKLKKKQVTVHVKSGSRRLRNSRQPRLIEMRMPPRELGSFKRRRLR